MIQQFLRGKMNPFLSHRQYLLLQSSFLQLILLCVLATTKAGATGNTNDVPKMLSTNLSDNVEGHSAIEKTMGPLADDYSSEARGEADRIGDIGTIGTDDDEPDDGLDEDTEEDETEVYWEEDDYFCYPLKSDDHTVDDVEVDVDFCYIDEEADWEEYNSLSERGTVSVHLVSPENDFQHRMPPQLSSYYLPFNKQPNFMLPSEIPPGKVETIMWRDTMKVVTDDEIFAVGLPPELLQEFRQYFDRNGILKIVEQLLYDENNTSAPGQPEHTKQNKDEEEGKTWTLDDGMKWSVKRADHWKSDMVWFDPVDEKCYESVRSILRRGNFDVVVEGIRKQLNLTKEGDLVVHGLGAIFVSHFTHSPSNGHLHRDIPDTRGAFYNILVPIYLPEKDYASLYIGGTDGRCSPINLQYNVATVIGSDSYHGTGDCDFRENGEFRLSMSIWVSEMTEENIQVISDDGLSPWPMPDDKDWYRAQIGRRLSTATDRGRNPSYVVRDKRDDCEKVKDQCDSDLWGVRAQCPLTCRAYMEDHVYHSYLDALKMEEARGSNRGSTSNQFIACAALIVLLLCIAVRTIRAKSRRVPQQEHNWSKLQHQYMDSYCD